MCLDIGKTSNIKQHQVAIQQNLRMFLLTCEITKLNKAYYHNFSKMFVS